MPYISSVPWGLHLQLSNMDNTQDTQHSFLIHMNRTLDLLLSQSSYHHMDYE